MANVSTDVHKKHIVRPNIGAQSADIIEVHPTGASLMVERHIGVELPGIFWVVFQELEIMESCLISSLERTIMAIRRIAISSPLEKSG